MKTDKVQYATFTGTNFKFKINPETLKCVSKNTGLSVDELQKLPLSEASALMEQRGFIKKPSKLKLFFQNMYNKFGEKFGLIKKQYNIYTDVD